MIAVAVVGLLAGPAAGAPTQGPGLTMGTSPPENPWTPEKALLGKILFADEQLSSDNSMACATCHQPNAGGADPRLGEEQRHPGLDATFFTADDQFGSPGILDSDAEGNFVPHALFGFDAQVTQRVAPSVIGAGWFDELGWDGAHGGTFLDPETGQVLITSGGALENACIAPLRNVTEMAYPARTWPQILRKVAASKPLALATTLSPDVAAELALRPTYPELFNEVFGDPAVNARRIAYSLAAYVRQFVPDDTPWDRFMAGDANAMTPQQQAGWTLFQDQGCVDCHEPPRFTNGEFRNIGVRPVDEDPGRIRVTGLMADRGKFKVPTLRNVGLRERYFHDGLRTSLNAIVNFYSGGGLVADNQDPLIVPLLLDSTERADLLAFLQGALDDDRVRFEEAPFDRPTLATESPTATRVLPNTGTPGTDGLVPRLLAPSPPGLGQRFLRIGLSHAAPNRWAFLSLTDPATGGLLSSGNGSPLRLGVLSRWQIVPTTGAGVILHGETSTTGFSTVQVGLPGASTSLAGQEVHAQWYVSDPGAAGGFAKSDVTVLTLF